MSSSQGPMKWEKVPSASEKNCQSKSSFTVKKDTIHIKTKTFSLWSVFACGGPKRKRATVFAHKPNADSDVIFLRFYIYSDNEDSKKVGDVIGYNSPLWKKWQPWARVGARSIMGLFGTTPYRANHEKHMEELVPFLKLQERILESLFRWHIFAPELD